MFSRGIEKEQWYVFRRYRKSSGMFSRGIEKAVVYFQGV